MRLIDGDRIITANIYDDEHEIFLNEKMSIIDNLNRYTDEGVTVADIIEEGREDIDKAFKALEDIGEIASCLVSIMEWESCYYQHKKIYEKAKKWDSGEVDFYE